MEEKKFICRFCNKKYPCGKSLGGHIRIHSSEYSPQQRIINSDKLKLSSLDEGRRRIRDSISAIEADANYSSYGLRANPKKTTRFVDSNTRSHQGKLCPDCGKEFSSSKALYGHMACHTEKDKGIDHKGDDESRLFVDSESDSETSSRKFRRMRFSLNPINAHHESASMANGSSSLSEVELEQEEVARCLMMLSKDTNYYKGCVNSVVESSDTNSVLLETKLSSIEKRISTKNSSKNFASRDYELVKKAKVGGIKLKLGGIGLSDTSDSGYYRICPKRVESDISDDGFVRNEDLKRYKVKRSGFANSDAELGKTVNGFRYKNTVPRKDEFKEVEYEGAHGGPRKYDSRKKANSVTLNSDSVEVSRKKFGNGNACYDSWDETYENSTDTDSFSAKKGKNKNISGSAKKKLVGSRKNNRHECPYCCRVFKSGQALGGHKRSHFVGSSEESTLVFQKNSPVVPTLIDLNLPAPVDE